jgi:epoxide hydrolase-like predicted phosphatase
MIKAIIFDLGGVLINAPEEDLINYCSEKFCIDKNLFREVFYQYITIFQKNEIAEEKMWEEISIKLNVKKPNITWREVVNNVFVQKNEVFELIKTLKKKYKTAVLTNTEVAVVDYFHENKLNEYFDELVFSCIEKGVKPEKEIYIIALNKLNCKPEETIFIDDRIENIEGANKLGINSILFKDINQLKKELKKFEINFI